MNVEWLIAHSRKLKGTPRSTPPQSARVQSTPIILHFSNRVVENAVAVTCMRLRSQSPKTTVDEPAPGEAGLGE